MLTRKFHDIVLSSKDENSKIAKLKNYLESLERTAISLAITSIVILSISIFITFTVVSKGNAVEEKFEIVEKTAIGRDISKLLNNIGSNELITGLAVNNVIKALLDFNKDYKTPLLIFYTKYTTNSEIASLIMDASLRHDVPFHLALSIAYNESRFKTKATSYNSDKTYDIGLFQLNSRTYSNIISKYGIKYLYDINNNIDLGIKHIKYDIEKNNGFIELAIISYNAGHQRIRSSSISKVHVNYLINVLKYQTKLDFDFTTYYSKILLCLVDKERGIK